MLKQLQFSHNYRKGTFYISSISALEKILIAAPAKGNKIMIITLVAIILICKQCSTMGGNLQLDRNYPHH